MKRRLVVVLVVILVILSLYLAGIGDYLSLDFVRSHLEDLRAFTQLQPVVAFVGGSVIYVVTTAFSLPGAAILTLLAGALFGLVQGTILVSFASTLGATLAFLMARFIARESVERKMGRWMAAINKGIEKEGTLYLLVLRLIPLVPFFVINLVMGLTKIKVWTFAWVSQLGMLPGTLVYVNAGRALADLRSVGDVATPSFVASMVALGAVPVIAKIVVARIRQRRALRGTPKPASFDYNLIVIGGGSAGLVSAYIGSAIRSRVALIERDHMGGDCLNTGCVPSKALLKAAKVVASARKAGAFGVRIPDGISVDFNAVMAHVRGAIAKVAPHDSEERYRKLGVDVVKGNAYIASPYAVEVNGRRLTTRAIIVAAGAAPFVPPFLGIDKVPAFTSDTIWKMESLPRRLLVVGGGPIGCELAQAFARLGSEVTLVERSQHLLSREDSVVGEELGKAFAHDGVVVKLASEITSFACDGDGTPCAYLAKSSEVILFDAVLIALGRKARTAGFGLAEVGVELRDNGTIAVDDYLRTTVPTIYACGDVAGPYQFTHFAAHQAWYASVNALLSPWWSFRKNDRVVPAVTYTDPEVARVGLNEREAVAQGVPFEVTLYGLDDLDRAIADGEDHGFVRILTVPGKDVILGVTIVGAHAGEQLMEFVGAMKHGRGLNSILGTIHPYPTHSEANKMAAGAWKRAHAPQGALRWLERFHAWRR